MRWFVQQTDEHARDRAISRDPRRLAELDLESTETRRGTVLGPTSWHGRKFITECALEVGSTDESAGLRRPASPTRTMRASTDGCWNATSSFMAFPCVSTRSATST